MVGNQQKPIVYLAGLKRDLRPLNPVKRMSVAGYHFPLSLSSLSMTSNLNSQVMIVFLIMGRYISANVRVLGFLVCEANQCSPCRVLCAYRRRRV